MEWKGKGGVSKKGEGEIVRRYWEKQGKIRDKEQKGVERDERDGKGREWKGNQPLPSPDECYSDDAGQRDGELEMSPFTDDEGEQSEKHPRCGPEQLERGPGERPVDRREQLARHYYPDQPRTLHTYTHSSQTRKNLEKKQQPVTRGKAQCIARSAPQCRSLASSSETWLCCQAG